jgi:hypothetical protein
LSRSNQLISATSLWPVNTAATRYCSISGASMRIASPDCVLVTLACHAAAERRVVPLHEEDLPGGAGRRELLHGPVPCSVPTLKSGRSPNG